MADKLVTIAKFADYIKANLAKQLLDDFGIKSIVADQNTTNIYSVSAIAEISLQVFERQAKQAQEILESQESQEEQEQ